MTLSSATIGPPPVRSTPIEPTPPTPPVPPILPDPETPPPIPSPDPEPPLDPPVPTVSAVPEVLRRAFPGIETADDGPEPWSFTTG